MDPLSVPRVCAPPNAVWVWMTLLGANTPLASGALRLFLAHEVTFSCAGETACGVDDVLFLRKYSFESIREHTLKWWIVDESAGHWYAVRASYLPKSRETGRVWVDTVFALGDDGLLKHVKHSEFYAMDQELSGMSGRQGWRFV
jgi:hypothetical protein